MLRSGEQALSLLIIEFAADSLSVACIREVLMDHFKGLELSETEGKQLLRMLALYEEKIASDSDMQDLVDSSSSEQVVYEAEPDSGDDGDSELAFEAAAHITSADDDS